jgi:hypothetical protein
MGLQIRMAAGFGAIVCGEPGRVGLAILATFAA